MVVLKLSGGLGNQLFEYAYGLWVSQYYQEELILDVSSFEKDVFRHLSLQHMSIPKMRFLNEEEKRWVKEKGIVVRRDCVPFWNAWKMSRGSEEPSYKLFISILISCFQNRYYKLMKKNSPKILGEGSYYQSEWYFKKITGKVRNYFRIGTLASEENCKLLREISNCTSVCVHIRRGDYLDPEWLNLQVCTEEYYYKAMCYIKRKIKDPVFYVFSNTHEDIAYIKNTFSFSGDIRYVDMDNPDYEELRLMSACKHFIICNSTFSWWGQYLADNPDKIVVAPKKWDKSGHRCEIYQEFWHLV